jgi:hypothetical protein
MEQDVTTRSAMVLTKEKKGFTKEKGCGRQKK